MCGIAGFVGEGDREILKRMASRIAHRGPDAEGFFVDEPGAVYLGHRRLSIVDLACGAQPMSTADGAVTVVFNGEIYNHLDLRKELQDQGCVFQTHHSDTEVLLHGWRVHGADFVNKLNGMWAFALWDARQNRLFLSRDRFGKKPLYWFYREGVFGFASELTSLIEHPAAPRSMSRRAIEKFFAYALIPAPHSAVDGIWKLPAAHNLVFGGDGPPMVSRYWRFEIEPDESLCGKDEHALGEQLLELLDHSVKRRLMADVPLGVFLSGGLDSTAVAALAARHVGAERLRTFSIGFRESTFDETAFARRAADFLRTHHRTEILDLDQACALLPEIFARLDEPQGDNSLLPTWLLSRFARREVTVALGGDGGDELFAGYDTFRGLRSVETYARLTPRPVHNAILAVANRLPVSHGNLSLDFKIKRVLRGIGEPQPLWNAVWLGALKPDELSRLFDRRVDAEEVYSEAIETWDACRQSNFIDRTLQFYTEIYLQDGILAKVDRASMMHGLEVRSPFLDVDVADFARRLPHHFKLRNGITKYLLKKALERILPADIIQRKKKGFGTPVAAWFHDGRLNAKDRGKLTSERVKSHREKGADERLFLWCRLVLDEWLARNERLVVPG